MPLRSFQGLSGPEETSTVGCSTFGGQYSIGGRICSKLAHAGSSSVIITVTPFSVAILWSYIIHSGYFIVTELEPVGSLEASFGGEGGGGIGLAFDFPFCFRFFKTVIQGGEAGLVDAVAECLDAAVRSEDVSSVFGVKGNNEGTVCRGIGEDGASPSPFVISFENLSTSTFNKIVANGSIVSIDTTISITSFSELCKKKKKTQHIQHPIHNIVLESPLLNDLERPFVLS